LPGAPTTDLRHACLSTWLNGGVYPTQVAEWAGHSVDVLLRIYAKCVGGQGELAKRRISEALRQDREPRNLARIWHSDLHLAAPGCIQPHNAEASKIAELQVFAQVTGELSGMKESGAGGARTHDRRIMRSMASCIARASCRDTKEPCRRWP
jgi:hypothetical protein